METIKYMLNGERVIKQTGGYRTYIDNPYNNTITQEYIEDEGIKELLLELQYQKRVFKETQETLLKITSNSQNIEQENTKLKEQIDELIKWLEKDKYENVDFCLNGTTHQYRLGYNEAIESILSKLKGSDK